jgi:hypothetical protein
MEKGDLFCLGLIVGSILGIIIHFCIISQDPTAMDVYRGKTTLEYVVVDGQVTDSTVIWKKDIQ